MIHEKAFRELSVDELYGILKLRQEVFVVEQTCAYLDCDDHDQASIHLFDERIDSYARVLPPGEKFAEASLGRVVSAKRVRRTGAGRAIVARAIEAIERRYGKVPIRISAQSYLARFYGDFGFVREGGEYLEDGIPHIAMVRPG
jgi:ElaA protein